MASFLLCMGGVTAVGCLPAWCVIRGVSVGKRGGEKENYELYISGERITTLRPTVRWELRLTVGVIGGGKGGGGGYGGPAGAVGSDFKVWRRKGFIETHPRLFVGRYAYSCGAGAGACTFL